jgi:hypothetical protein
MPHKSIRTTLHTLWMPKLTGGWHPLGLSHPAALRHACPVDVPVPLVFVTTSCSNYYFSAYLKWSVPFIDIFVNIRLLYYSLLEIQALLRAGNSRQRPTNRTRARPRLTENFFSAQVSRRIFSRPRLFASTRARGSRHRLCREPTVGRRPKKVAVNGGLDWRFFEIFFADVLKAGPSAKRGVFIFLKKPVPSAPGKGRR